MPVALGNNLRVAARHLWNAQDDIVNVFTFKITTIPGSPNDTACMIDLAEMLTVAYQAIDSVMSYLVTINDIRGYNLTQDTPMPTVPWDTPYAGGLASGDAMPSGIAPLVLWYTSVKRTVGKTFLPPFAEATQHAGSLNGTATNDIENWAAAMRDDSPMTNGYGFELGVWKRALGQPVAITGHNVRSLTAYQRRRKPGVGS